MGEWKIGTGAGGGAGGKFDKAAHEGHVVFAVGVTSEPDQSTAYGSADAARCEYFGCIDDGEVLTDYLLFGTALVPIFVADAEAGYDVIAGRLVKGTAKAGQNAPWLLETPDDDDLERLEKWLDAHATRLKSGRITIEADPPANAEAADDDEPF